MAQKEEEEEEEEEREGEEGKRKDAPAAMKPGRKRHSFAPRFELLNRDVIEP